jgi:DNA-binding MarR family transcriptional regulator
MTDLRKVFDDLVRFETVLWNTIDERLQAGCGLTLSSLNLMLVIDGTPECRVLDIAESLAITVGGTSQAVDRLERSGLCRRRSHPTDRRSSIIELTLDGQEALRGGQPIFDNELTRLIGMPLTSGTLPAFASALETLRARLVSS